MEQVSGVKFYDWDNRRFMCLQDVGDFPGWLCYLEGEGLETYWVQYRCATEEDYKLIGVHSICL